MIKETAAGAPHGRPRCVERAAAGPSARSQQRARACARAPRRGARARRARHVFRKGQCGVAPMRVPGRVQGGNTQPPAREAGVQGQPPSRWDGGGARGRCGRWRPRLEGSVERGDAVGLHLDHGDRVAVDLAGRGLVVHLDALLHGVLHAAADGLAHRQRRLGDDVGDGGVGLERGGDGARDERGARRLDLLLVGEHLLVDVVGDAVVHRHEAVERLLQRGHAVVDRAVGDLHRARHGLGQPRLGHALRAQLEAAEDAVRGVVERLGGRGDVGVDAGHGLLGARVEAVGEAVGAGHHALHRLLAVGLGHLRRRRERDVQVHVGELAVVLRAVVRLVGEARELHAAGDRGVERGVVHAGRHVVEALGELRASDGAHRVAQLQARARRALGHAGREAVGRQHARLERADAGVDGAADGAVDVRADGARHRVGGELRGAGEVDGELGDGLEAVDDDRGPRLHEGLRDAVELGGAHGPEGGEVEAHQLGGLLVERPRGAVGRLGQALGVGGDRVDGHDGQHLALLDHGRHNHVGDLGRVVVALHHHRLERGHGLVAEGHGRSGRVDGVRHHGVGDDVALRRRVDGGQHAGLGGGARRVGVALLRRVEGGHERRAERVDHAVELLVQLPHHRLARDREAGLVDARRERAGGHEAGHDGCQQQPGGARHPLQQFVSAARARDKYSTINNR
ncbi:MAG: hypothetical protein J3K34DRAFT_418053 [Monoraphidium minutum]|nr:MAG: hypothetical protein J3K34DRAFT_418053 [Monoraphidium minutum]